MKRHALERAFLRQAQTLWDAGTPLLAALSGGIDSMALWALLASIQSDWPSPLTAIHVDHGLRPDSTAQAGQLADMLHQYFRTPLTVIRVDAAPRDGESMEMAARRARYKALLGAAQEQGPDARLLVAHQQNDQAETVLMRVLMGTGVKGLAAMRPRQGRILRPLLPFSRPALAAYLEGREIPWMEDPTNADPVILRNRIRCEVLPFLTDRVNAQAVWHLAMLAERAQDHDAAIEYMLRQWMPAGAVADTAEGLRVAPLWRQWPDELTTRVLRAFAERHGVRITARHLKEALAGASDWPGGWRVRVEADGHLSVRKGASTGITVVSGPVRVDQAGDIPWGGRTLVIREAVFDGPVDPEWLALSQERWPAFWVRSWQDGDRIRPLGLRGHSKKLQDVWTDAKVPIAERRQLPILADKSEGGVVLMVPGLLSSFDGWVERGAKAWLVRLR